MSQQRTCLCMLHRRADRRASLWGQLPRHLCQCLPWHAAYISEFKRQEGGAIAESLAKKARLFSSLHIQVMGSPLCLLLAVARVESP